MEYKVKNFNELMESIDKVSDALGDNGYNLWWRGQAKEWPLIPCAHRPEQKLLNEKTALMRFRRQALTRGAPKLEDSAINWLLIMQHYGAGTRLLDWSESAMVACYFICDDLQYKDEPGRLAALYPNILNEYLIGKKGVPSSTHTTIKNLADVVGEIKDVPKGAAFIPLEFDQRMMVQHTTFTIHSDDTPLEKPENSSKYLKLITIMPDAKHEIAKRLFQFGFRQSLLFPDLANLAQEIRSLRHPD